MLIGETAKSMVLIGRGPFNLKECLSKEQFCDLHLQSLDSSAQILCHKIVLTTVCPSLRLVLTQDEVDTLILPDFQTQEIASFVKGVYACLGQKETNLIVSESLVQTLGVKVRNYQDGDFKELFQSIHPFTSDPGLLQPVVKVEPPDDPDDLMLGTDSKPKRGAKRRQVKKSSRASRSSGIKEEPDQEQLLVDHEDEEDKDVDEIIDDFVSDNSGNEEGSSSKRRRKASRKDETEKQPKRRGRVPTTTKVKPDDLEKIQLPMRGSRFERVIQKDGEIVYETQMPTQEIEKLSPKQLTRKIRHAKAVKQKRTQIETFQCDCLEVSSLKTFRDKEAHFRLVHCGDKFSQCKMCKRVMLKEHLEEHKNNCADELSLSICPHCGKEFKSLNALNTHINGVHKVWTCKVCQVSFNGYIRYRRHHLTEHTKPWHCDKCTMVFKAEQNLKDHYIRVHLPHHMRPFVCELCGHGFIYKDKLRIHMMNMHVRTRPHICRCGCDFAFNDPSTRRAHERKQHPGHPMNQPKKAEL
eukprot:TCALIF_02935-PA protein Name:"Similar to Znf652 Zinc finger protein 652 (Mus musculus)" AED:0.26 eAED:0.26 QI:0/0/0/0.33/1/1/3/0/523